MRHINLAKCSTLLIVSSLYLSAAGAADEPSARWPQFRGPGGSGVGEGTAPIEFGPQKNVRWVSEVPSGVSSPCIWDGRVFLTGYDSAERKLQVLCLDRADGRVVWSTTVEAPQIETVHRLSSPASGTPVADGERVYVYFGSVGLLAFDFDGKPVWQHALPPPGHTFGSGTSPALSGEMVLVNRECAGDSFLLAVDRRTGAEVWRHPHKKFAAGPMDGYATPVVWDGRIIMHQSDGVRAFSAQDGSERWVVRVMSEASSTPVVTEDAVYVCAWMNSGEPELRVAAPKFADLLKDHDQDGDGKLSKEEFPKDLALTRRPEIGETRDGEMRYSMFYDRLDSNKDGAVSTLEWAGVQLMMSLMMSADHGVLAIRPEGTGDVSRTHIAWKQTRQVPEVPSPLLYQGRLYLIKDGGVLACLDPQTGDVKYRARIGAGGGYYASPVAADGRVYLASQEGVVTVVAAGDELKILATNDLGESLMATPAIVDDTLYVRTASKLYAFRE